MTDTTRPLAVITGASAGIGVAFAEAFAARGYDLMLVARRLNRLEELGARLSKAHGVTCYPVSADLSVTDAHLPIVEALAKIGRTPVALVNNAGYSLGKAYCGHAWTEQRDFIMTLVMSVAGLTHALLPGMLAAGGGRVINVGSIAGFAPGGSGHTLYPAAKSFVIRFSQSLHAEYGKRGIKVTCVNPGSTESDFTTANGTTEVLKEAPRGPVMTAASVVALALRANDKGKVIEVPGLHNKIVVALMTHLPGLMAMIIHKASDKYRLPD